MDRDVQKYVSKDQEASNRLLESYKGHRENKWIVVSKIGLVV